MKRCALSIVLALLLTACVLAGQDDTLISESNQAVEEISTWQSGQQAYARICAGCHEEGHDGAPRTGDREAWNERSRLWEAVLFEHAKNGYYEMPAKGGDETLDDATVARAAEYMLTLTYPETHRD
jgi:cytochrome c5